MNYRIEQLRYQLREDPSSRAFLRLAALLREGGEPAEAADVLRRGLNHHPRSLAAWLALGRTLRDVGEGAGAEEAFGRAHALDAGNAEAAQALAEAAIGRDDWTAAATLLEPLRGLAPENEGLAAMCAEVDAWTAAEERRLAEEAAQRAAEAEAEAEARRRRAERLARPPTDVLRLADGDPFANLTAVGIEAGAEVQDVFAEPADEPPALEPEPVVEELAAAEAAAEVSAEPHEPESGSWADLAQEPTVEPEPLELTEPIAAEMVEEASPGVELPELAPDEPEPESWADLAQELAVEPELPEFTEPIVTEVAEDVAAAIASAEDEREAAAAVVAEAVVEPLPVAPPGEAEEPEPESWADLAAEVGAEPEPAFAGELAEIVPEVEEILEQPVEDDEPPARAAVAPDDRPLPTLTLARLAAHQGAYDLAATTLERLLEREPDNLEAAEFLERLRAGEPAPGEHRGAAAKVAALRAWLDTIRLASERHSP